jgi:hypothetical protein
VEAEEEEAVKGRVVKEKKICMPDRKAWHKKRSNRGLRAVKVGRDRTCERKVRKKVQGRRRIDKEVYGDW